jgi:manganese efflux pump family protein
LLFFIGGKMCYESVTPGETDRKRDCPDPTKGFSLILLSFATSIDALGVGFSLGILDQSLLVAAVWIGIIACAMTWLAMKLGDRLSESFGHRMGVFGGIILMAIAVKLLVW